MVTVLQEQLSNPLENLLSGLGEGIGGAAPEAIDQIRIARAGGDVSQLSPRLQNLVSQQQLFKQKIRDESNKQLQQQREQEILAKRASGQELTQGELQELSATSLRSISKEQQPVFEKEADKLEAKRVSELATDISNDFQAAKSEDMRLDRMEVLDEGENLSTPLMVKSLQALGLPLGVLSNPDSEEFAKLEAEFLRDVRQVFPGGRITNYEIQAYLKGIPNLMNSSEGRKAIIRNRRLINDGKKVRYNAYKDILKENGGRKPPNLDVLIQERTSEEMARISDEFRDNVQSTTEQFQQPIRMQDKNGKIYNIPPNKIEQALNDQFSFAS
jgi:hypothetical protein